MIGKPLFKLNKDISDHFVFSNENAFHYIMENQDKLENINYCLKLYINENPLLIPLINEHIGKTIDYLYTMDHSQYENEDDIPNEYVQDDLTIKYRCFNQIFNSKNVSGILDKYSSKLPPRTWGEICQNIHSIPLIEKNLDKLNDNSWRILMRNENAIPILEQNMDKISWWDLSLNNNALHLLQDHVSNLTSSEWYHIAQGNELYIQLLTDNLDRIELCDGNRCYDQLWELVYKNPHAISLIEFHIHENNVLEEIDLFKNTILLIKLCRNKNAIHIIEKYIDYLMNRCPYDCLRGLCRNENAMHILERYLDLLDNQEWSIEIWSLLSSKPYAIHILEKNIDKIHWYELSFNKNAGNIVFDNIEEIDDNLWKSLCNILPVEMFERNMDKIPDVCWEFLSMRKDTFHLVMKLKYDEMYENMNEFRHELLGYLMNPDRIKRLSNEYDIEFNEYLKLITC
jgi:hypothetical protein